MRAKRKKRQNRREKSLHTKYFIWYLYMWWGQVLLSICRFVHYISNVVCDLKCALNSIWCTKKRTSFADNTMERDRERRWPGSFFVTFSTIHIRVLPTRKYIEAHAFSIHIWFATHIYYFIIIVIIIISIVYVCMLEIAYSMCVVCAHGVWKRLESMHIRTNVQIHTEGKKIPSA